jgi:hypothetical protein
MTESEVVHRAVTGSLEVATRFLNHFLSAGEVFRNNGEAFFKVGDFRNTPAKQRGPMGGSVYLKLPELCGSDRTTGEKVHGPVPIIRLLRGCDASSAVAEVKQWLADEGIDTGEGEETKSGRKRADAFPWSAAVADLSDARLRELEHFRGYPPDLCQRIRRLELIARVDRHWCFPITNRNGVVIGINQLVRHPYFDPAVMRQQWVPKPLGVDRSVWNRIGAPLTSATLVIICESAWDALAVLSLYTDAELADTAILATHGTGGDTLPRFTTNVKRVVVAVQNDAPSQRWAEKLARQAGGYDLAVVLPPGPEKDFNDLLRKGLLKREDFDKAAPRSVDPATGRVRVDLRPWYAMFSDTTESGPALEEGVRLMADSKQLFEVGYLSPTERGLLTWLRPERAAVCLDEARVDFNQIFQSFARTCQQVNTKKGPLFIPKPLDVRAVNLLLKGWSHSEAGLLMPQVDHILERPSFVQDENGALALPAPGYHPVKGGSIFVQSAGPAIPDMEFEQAKDVVAEYVEEFDGSYAEGGDRSRYYVLLFAPEMQSAGFLPGNYPFAIFDAADVNFGKSSAARRIFLFYGEAPAMVMPVEGRAGVANFEILLSAAVATLKRFIFIDNFRGSLRSPVLEAMLTEHRAQIRPSYSPEREVSVAGRSFNLTSNLASPNPDLMSRSLAVRLAAPAKWKTDKVTRENQIRSDYARYTAARRAIIRRWDAEKRPRVEDKRHRFTDFFAPMCGLVEGTLGMKPVLDGMEAEAAWRTDVNAVWLRSLANFYRTKGLDLPRGAKELVDDCRAHQMYPPNYIKGHDVRQLKQDIGITLRAAADGRSQVDLGLFTAFLINSSTAKPGSQYSAKAWQVYFKLKS